MKMIRCRPAALAAALLALPAPLPAAAQSQPVAAAAPAPARLTPALWKVADEDTTIYLFGTIHALPPGLDWMNGEVAEALAASSELVTEIHDPSGSTATQEAVRARGMLRGETLRSLMADDDRAAMEALLKRLGMGEAALDHLKPWMAAITLATLPYLRGGYDPAAGVEKVLEGRVAKQGGHIAGLETADYQLSLFDGLPRETQLEFLASTVRDFDRSLSTIADMVREWGEGDAEGLARLVNESLDQPELAETLLHQRNRAWAAWIGKRLNQPGSVFMAVGAGHLAGQGSVQDALAARGLRVVRVR